MTKVLVPVTRFIVGVIVCNAITLALEMSQTAMVEAGGLLLFLDKTAPVIFVIETALKLTARNWRYFKRGWNIFDVTIIAISLLPATGSLSVCARCVFSGYAGWWPSFPSCGGSWARS